MADECFAGLFKGCTALIVAPALPATTLAISCYIRMFSDCASLTQAPALPATTLPACRLPRMFSGGASLTQSSTQTGEYMQAYRIPSFGAGVTASGALSYMFGSTGGTFTETPEINTTYYLSNTNTVV